jgi:4-hydroxy-tetrahydrodipicolinate synthase
MSELKLRGVFTALVTPFDAHGALDLEAFERLVTRQLEAGIHGLVPCGTTGETPTLSDDEWESLISSAVRLADGKVPVIPGTGTNNTDASIARTKRARELGADAALVVTPYYNKPNHAGLRRHYHLVADEGGLPVVFYNVPSRTGLNAQPESILDIATHPGICAVKEASGNLGQAMTLIRDRRAGLSILSGEDDMTCAMTLMGGDGVISVYSNVDPKGFVAMVEAALSGRIDEARELHYKRLELERALFNETNPVPAKAALAHLGLCTDAVRTPLASANDSTKKRVAAAIESAGVEG